jgi:hypothetical protein
LNRFPQRSHACRRSGSEPPSLASSMSIASSSSSSSSRVSALGKIAGDIPSGGDCARVAVSGPRAGRAYGCLRGLRCKDADWPMGVGNCGYECAVCGLSSTRASVCERWRIGAMMGTSPGAAKDARRVELLSSRLIRSTYYDERFGNMYAMPPAYLETALAAAEDGLPRPKLAAVGVRMSAWSGEAWAGDC